MSEQNYKEGSTAKGIGYFSDATHPAVAKIEEICGFRFEKLLRVEKIHLLQYLAEIVESEYGDPNAQVTMLVEDLEDLPMDEQTAIALIKAIADSL